MDKLSIEDLEELLERKRQESKEVRAKNKRMKTGKKAFWLGFTLSIALIIFSGIMIILDKDTQTVAIFGGAGVAVLPIIFGIYEHFSTKISLKHMEKNYIPNYDDERGIY